MKHTKLLALSAFTILALSSVNVTQASSLFGNSGGLFNGSSNSSSSVGQSDDIMIATNAVENLFTDSTHTAVKSTTTSDSILAARRLILKCPAMGSYITTLANLCTKAETLVNQSSNDPATKVATTAIDNLFTDSTHTAIKKTTTEAKIQAARLLIFKLPAMSKNIRPLNDLCTKAERLLYTV